MYNSVENIWINNQNAIHSTLQKWAAELDRNNSFIRTLRSRFRVRKPLMAYMNASQAMTKKGTIEFSLRYRGQEVGRVQVDRNNVKSIFITTSKNNKNYFKGYSSLKLPDSFPWDKGDGRKFRRYFSNPQLSKNLKSPEHELESMLIRRVKEGRLHGIGGIKPVELGDIVPFQFPLPISAHTGTPKYGKGNVDIVVREGHGRGVRISVWELKKEGQFKEAVRQAYIYALVIHKILQCPSGPVWKKLMGVSHLNTKTINVRVVVSRDMKSDFEKSLTSLKVTDDKYIGKNGHVHIEPLYYERTYEFM